MKEAFFTEKGTYYRTNDLREGRTTLLFIHGLSGSSSAWADYEAAFEHEYNVVSVDLRGHGKSLKPNVYDAYEVEKISGDIAALLDRLSISSFIPISHSFGTLIAVSLLRQHTQGAVANIFLSPTYGIFRIPLTRVSRVVITLWTQLARRFSYSEEPGIHVDYSKYRRSGDWNLRRIAADLPNVTVHIYLYCLNHVYAQDLDSWWRELRLPVLIVHGTRDTISPAAQSARLARELPNAKLVVVEGANHILPLNRFEHTCGIVREYLREHAQR